MWCEMWCDISYTSARGIHDPKWYVLRYSVYDHKIKTHKNRMCFLPSNWRRKYTIRSIITASNQQIGSCNDHAAAVWLVKFLLKASNLSLQSDLQYWDSTTFNKHSFRRCTLYRRVHYLRAMMLTIKLSSVIFFSSIVSLYLSLS
jgi:hypothetical protein